VVSVLHRYRYYLEKTKRISIRSNTNITDAEIAGMQLPTKKHIKGTMAINSVASRKSLVCNEAANIQVKADNL